jgi:predicted enzyme related to lactoylglutathione lyase
MNRFIHFELATNDLEKTAAFYREVFGWKIEKWDGPVEYWLVTTGEQGEPGIDGGLMKADEFFTGTVNTIGVEDIDAAIEKVKACGGEIILPKDLIPEVGYQAYFRDPTGIIVGLHQRLPGTQMS